MAPARVQGQGASKEIIAGIKDLEKIALDVIIVARGGGSIEELWVFNDEELARVAFASPIPLISAIGHERDYTILDYVADVRAATPSEAAELVITPSYELQERINKYERRLESSLMGKVQNSRLELEHLLQRRVLKHPLGAQNVSRQRVDDLAQRLEFALRQKMNLSRENFKTWLAKLDGLSPLKIMSLGYSVCKDAQSGEILVSSENLKKGDLLEIMFAKGEARLKVEGLS
ncbi:MAG: exodeoxyribonuclease VII large subunit, partial [Fibrobacter sp.]|nr:exodeoxyribonuclease VII large subunit [Fibrobacter sp.]